MQICLLSGRHDDPLTVWCSWWYSSQWLLLLLLLSAQPPQPLLWVVRAKFNISEAEVLFPDGVLLMVTLAGRSVISKYTTMCLRDPHLAADGAVTHRSFFAIVLRFPSFHPLLPSRFPLVAQRSLLDVRCITDACSLVARQLTDSWWKPQRRRLRQGYFHIAMSLCAVRPWCPVTERPAPS